MAHRLSVGRAERALPRVSAILCSLLLAGSSSAESQIPSASHLEVTSSADTAFQNTQSPDVFRALIGAGDPHIDEGFSHSDEYFSEADTKKLLSRLAGASGEPPDGLGVYDLFTCRLDQPLTTLRQRMAALGPNHPYVVQWIKAEQAVLALCKEGRSETAATYAPPSPLATRDPAVARLQRADRAYQAATASFYQGDVTGALRSYDRIARSKSTLRPFALYMSVAIRAGTRPIGVGYQPLEPVARSISAAQALLADPKMKEVHRYAYDLIGWIGDTNQSVEARRAQDRQALAALEEPLSVLETDVQAQRHYADIRDGREFLFSSPKDAAVIWNGAIPEEQTGLRAMAEAARRDPLAEWMIFPVSPYQPQSSDHGAAQASWVLVPAVRGGARVQTELAHLAPNPGDASNPWAHERLMWSEHYDPALWKMVEAEELRAGAAPDQRWADASELDLYHETRTAIMFGGAAGFEQALSHLQPPANPRQMAWSSTIREALRFLMVKGRFAEARRMRDHLELVRLVQIDDERGSDSSLEGGQSFRENGILDVLLLLAEDEAHLAPLLSSRNYDQAPLLNQLSIRELQSLAERGDVPKVDRATFSRTAWARTYALGRPVPARLDKLMRSLNPDITAGWLSRAGRPITPNDRRALQDILVTPALNVLITDYGRRPKTEDARFAGHTVLGIDHNTHDEDDWWCPWRPQTDAALEDQTLAQTLTGFDGDLSPEETQPEAPLGPRSLWDRSRKAILQPLATESVLLRSRDPAEIADLARIRSAPELLTIRTIDWVEHPGFLRSRKGQADALAAAVATTRWGCTWAGAHGVYSHAAFNLLHQRFPQTPAAGRTRYWFNCNGACATADGSDNSPASLRSKQLPSAPTLPRPPSGEIVLEKRIWGSSFAPH